MNTGSYIQCIPYVVPFVVLNVLCATFSGTQSALRTTKDRTQAFSQSLIRLNIRAGKRALACIFTGTLTAISHPNHQKIAMFAK
jgi:hypothetical protein